MTKKKFPCFECDAVGYEPHSDWCDEGKRRSKAAKKTVKVRKYVKAQKAKRQSKPKKQLVNDVTIILDRSGSMARIKQNVIEAVNAQIAKLKDEAIKNNQKTLLSLYLFSDNVECLYKNVSITSFVPLYDISIYGMTALMDAVGFACDKDQYSYANNEDVSYLVITITDGMENRSHSYTRQSFVKKINELNATDKYTFVFNGPVGSRLYLEELGIHPGNIQEWEQTYQGTFTMSQHTQSGISNYYTTRSAGHTSTKQFFNVDMSNVQTRDLRQLRNVASNYKVLKVTNAAPDGKEWLIKDFVVDRLGLYEIGRAYYELTKTEEVQPQKDILILDRNTNKLYGGYDARQLIGINSVDVCRVSPKNVGNYSIFIKSTSVNRKLVRGTKVLYRK